MSRNFSNSIKEIKSFDYKAFFKSVDYRHYICLALTAALITACVFLFPYAGSRFLEGCRDVYRSIAYQWTTLLDLPQVAPSVVALSKMPFTVSDKLPPTWEAFVLSWSRYWELFIDTSNLRAYFLGGGFDSKILSIILIVGVPVVLVFVFVFIYLVKEVNNNYNVETKPLKVFKRISDHTYVPVKNWVIGFCKFIVENKAYYMFWLCVMIFCFNGFTILLEILAYYFYFTTSFDIASLYLQVYKLILDLSVMFKFIPSFVWGLIAVVVFVSVRKSRGYKNLQHLELRNRGFINARGVVNYIVAPMRQGKNKAEVSMMLSKEIMMRDDAYATLYSCAMKFPYFPWLSLEMSIVDVMDKGIVYNLATCRRYIKSKRLAFARHPKPKYIFNYDYLRYSLEYDNKKTIEYIFDVLETYAQAYFIYIIQSSLITSNYSVRSDNVLESEGNFPTWDVNLFKVKSKDVKARSKFSHIVNYDVFRIAKKVAGKSAYAFEFGILGFSEFDKEYENQLESQGVRKDDEEANQKNDGFAYWLKMCGHLATVDFKCYVSMFADMQREDSIPANLRGVGDILRIESNEKGKLALPGFFVEEIVYYFAHKFNNWFFLKYRVNKGNNTLLFHLMETIFAKIENYYSRIYNLFGYEHMKISVQDGAKNNDKVLHSYYILNKKDLADRYCTDCLSESLSFIAREAKQGLDDVDTYATGKASNKELAKQHSYFFGKIQGFIPGLKTVKKKQVTKSSAVVSDEIKKRILAMTRTKGV
jgi:hypothetical protein